MTEFVIALSALIVAVTTLFTALIGLFKLWMDLRSVHEIVNSQRTGMIREIHQLKVLLGAADDRADAAEEKAK